MDRHEGQALREDPGEDLPLRVRVVLPETAGAEPADVELRREVIEVGCTEEISTLAWLF